MSKLELDRVIFIGRTFEEYIDMFSLDIEELKGLRVLDCPWRSVFVYGKGN